MAQRQQEHQEQQMDVDDDDQFDFMNGQVASEEEDEEGEEEEGEEEEDDGPPHHEPDYVQYQVLDQQRLVGQVPSIDHADAGRDPLRYIENALIDQQSACSTREALSLRGVVLNVDPWFIAWTRIRIRETYRTYSLEVAESRFSEAEKRMQYTVIQDVAKAVSITTCSRCCVAGHQAGQCWIHRSLRSIIGGNLLLKKTIKCIRAQQKTDQVLRRKSDTLQIRANVIYEAQQHMDREMLRYEFGIQDEAENNPDRINFPAGGPANRRDRADVAGEPQDNNLGGGGGGNNLNQDHANGGGNVEEGRDLNQDRGDGGGNNLNQDHANGGGNDEEDHNGSQAASSDGIFDDQMDGLDQLGDGSVDDNQSRASHSEHDGNL